MGFTIVMAVYANGIAMANELRRMMGRVAIMSGPKISRQVRGTGTINRKVKY